MHSKVQIVDSARAVFGALLFLEESGLNIAATRLSAVKQLNDCGLRERDLVAQIDSIEHRKEEMNLFSNADIADIARSNSEFSHIDKYLSVGILAQRAMFDD